jgi:hypothetical protein
MFNDRSKPRHPAEQKEKRKNDWIGLPAISIHDLCVKAAGHDRSIAPISNWNKIGTFRHGLGRSGCRPNLVLVGIEKDVPLMSVDPMLQEISSL